jgi:ligand-binding sensor domain-containing protein
MRLINDTLWVATSGGILAITDVDSPGRKFDNLDGLGTTDITDIIEDADGQKWVTGFGRLIKFTEEDSKQFLFEKDNSLLPLRCVIDDRDNLWVGAEIGLVLFSKTIDGGQIQDSYHQFGNLNPNPVVNDILLVGDTIWIATSSGLAVAEKTNPSRLKSPAAWTVFGIDNYPELGTEDMRRVIWFEQALYIGTAKGMFRLDKSPSDTSFTMMPIGVNATFTDLKIENDSLFFYYRWGMGVAKDSFFTALPRNGLPESPHTGLNNGSFRWVGLGGDGIYNDRDSAGTYFEYPYTGPPGNNVSDLVIDKQGVVTAGFTEQPAAQYENGTWRAYDFYNRTTKVMLDSAGCAWVGTWGNGVWIIKDDTAVNYDETNSTLRGIPGDEEYVVIRGLANDGRYIYAACYLALNGYPIAIGNLSNLDNLSGWDSLGRADGFANEYVVSVDCYNGWLAVGTEAAGVFVCYLGDDPFDHSSRSCQQYTTESGLNSNVVKVVRYSPDGDLWVGTNFGLSRWDLDRFAEVTPPAGIGNDISALEFDGRGNLWIGSNNGLARVDGATGTSTVYIAGNSGLVSDKIANLTLDPITSDLYVATPAGISILQSGVNRFTSLIDEVIAYPNPFIIRSDRDRLRFNFSRSGTVRLFTVAGELVTEFPVGPWDGRNMKGQQVASGVYVYVLSDEDGGVGRGKVLLVREE